MSMIDNRLKPNTTAPPDVADPAAPMSDQVPGSSGPRWRIRCDDSDTASTVSAVTAADGSRTRASSPHIGPSMPQASGGLRCVVFDFSLFSRPQEAPTCDGCGC